MRNPDIMTSGEAADLCGVAARTMSKWIDGGLIPGSYMLPLSRDRRVPREALMTFMRMRGMMGVVLPSVRRLLWVGMPGEMLGHALVFDGWSIDIAATVFDAGKAFVACRPSLILVDRGMGCVVAGEIRQSAGQVDPPVPMLLYGYHERWLHEFIDDRWQISDQAANINAILDGSLDLAHRNGKS